MKARMIMWQSVRLALVLTGVLSVAGCGSRSSGGDKPLVFVCIPPQAVFVRALAGDLADCRVLLPAGSSPVTYDPRPSQLRDLAEADVYVRAGVPFEVASWDKIRDTNRSMRVVDVATETGLRKMDKHSHGEGEEHHEHHEHHEGEDATDPHTWLNPKNAGAQAAAISEVLSGLLPGHEEELSQRRDRFLTELNSLDSEIREALAPVKGKCFWVHHPAWGYFADEYGLHQHSVEREGKEPGPQSMAAMVAEMKAEGVRVIFYDPQFSTKQVEVIAREAGVEIQPLNPLAEDYFANLRAAARAILEALQ